MKKFLPLIGMTLILIGCGTSPEPDYFSLARLQGAPRLDTVTVVKIQRPVLAGYLDRPDFVRQIDAYQLVIDETANWAEPLDEMVARILASDLQQRLPASLVVSEDDITPTNTRFVVNMNIDRFNWTDDGKVEVQGSLVITDKEGRVQARPTPLALSIEAGSSSSSIVAGLSRLTAALADQISETIATSLTP